MNPDNLYDKAQPKVKVVSQREQASFCKEVEALLADGFQIQSSSSSSVWAATFLVTIHSAILVKL